MGRNELINKAIEALEPKDRFCWNCGVAFKGSTVICDADECVRAFRAYVDRRTLPTMLDEPIQIERDSPPPPPGKHDWAEEIVGYRPQAEPDWVTKFGYRPPIRRYTCKRCGDKFTTGSVSTALMRLTDDCPGSE